MLSESKQMNSVPICGMHAIRIQSSVHSISRILRTTYNPFNILRTLLKAKREKKNEKESMHKIYYKIFIVQREPKKKKKTRHPYYNYNNTLPIVANPERRFRRGRFNGAHNRTDP